MSYKSLGCPVKFDASERWNIKLFFLKIKPKIEIPEKFAASDGYKAYPYDEVFWKHFGYTNFLQQRSGVLWILRKDLDGVLYNPETIPLAILMNTRIV